MMIILVSIFFIFFIPLVGKIVLAKLIDSMILSDFLNDTALGYFIGYVFGSIEVLFMMILLSQLIKIGVLK